MPKCTESEVLGIVLFLALWVLGCILLGMVESMKKKYDLVTYRAVSYTHLDVYKRQGKNHVEKGAASLEGRARGDGIE